MNQMFLIVLDLISTTHDYTAFFDTIKRLGPWWHYLKTGWVVQTQTRLNEVVDTLRQHIAEGDHFMVVDISRMPRDGWLQGSAWDWLRAHEADASSGNPGASTGNR